MTELELRRAPGERRVHAIDGVGKLRLEGLASRTATAEAGAQSWRFVRRKAWSRALEAVDSSGATVGAYEPRRMRRGGQLHWGGRELVLRPVSRWRERYALADGDREVVVLDGSGWGRASVKVMKPDLEALDPGLLLFAAFVVRGAAQEMNVATAPG